MRKALFRGTVVGVSALALLGLAQPASAATTQDQSCLSEYRYYAEYPLTSGDPTFVNQPGYTVLYYYVFTSQFVSCVAGP